MILVVLPAAFATVFPTASSAQLGGRATPWRHLTPPTAIEGLLDARPATTLELSRGWLARVSQVRRTRDELISRGELDGLSPVAAASKGAALAGVLRIPVIPVHYADVAPPFGTARLEQRLFGTSVADTLSYADYWREVSGGLLKVTGEVAPWIPLQGEAQHYLPASAYGWAQFGRISELRTEALRAADAVIDFSGFDNDGPDGIPNSGDDDGFVDFVAFVYALPCPGDSETGAIWPHRAAMQPFSTDDTTADGRPVRIADYVILPAVDLETCGPLHIGLLAHETGHALGLPDLYDYDGSSHGIGDWGLMGTGSHGRLFSPSHLSAWEKEQLGWVRVSWLKRDTASLRIAPVERDRTVYRYDADDGSGRYLLLENRQRIGSDKKLPGQGLLTWQVDPERGELGVWNRDERRTAVGLAQSDGPVKRVGIGRADGRDPLPGRSGRQSFRWRIDRAFSLTDVVEERDGIRADVTLRRSEPALVASPSTVHMTGVEDGGVVQRAVIVRRNGPSFAFTPVERATWLSIEATAAGDMIMLTADPAGLEPGEYADTLRLVDGSGMAAAQVVVRLDVVRSGVSEVIATELPWGWGIAAHGGMVLQASYGRDPLGARPRPRVLELPAGTAHPVTLSRLPADAIYAPVVDGTSPEAFVLARADDRNFVYRIAANGSAQLVAADVGEGPAYGAARLPDGTLLVAEYSGQIHRVTEDGRVSPYTRVRAELYQLATDTLGNVFAATYDGTILRIAPDGALTWMKTGFGKGGLVAIAATQDGHVYAAQRGGEGRIVRFTPEGKRTVIYREDGAQFYGLALDGSFLYALDLTERQLLRLPVPDTQRPAGLAVFRAAAVSASRYNP